MDELTLSESKPKPRLNVLAAIALGISVIAVSASMYLFAQNLELSSKTDNLSEQIVSLSKKNDEYKKLQTHKQPSTLSKKDTANLHT